MRWQHACRQLRKHVILLAYVCVCIAAHNIIEGLHYQHCRKNIWLSLTLDKTRACTIAKDAVRVVDSTCIAAGAQLVWMVFTPILKIMQTTGVDVEAHITEKTSSIHGQNWGDDSTSDAESHLSPPCIGDIAEHLSYDSTHSRNPFSHQRELYL